jgi:uncharacterized membrane protein (UPF0127 family)
MAAARLLILTALIGAAWLSVGCSSEEPPAAATTPAVVDESLLEVTIKGKVFRLELALDEDSRFQGLSDRAEIADDGGMLFVFPDADLRQFVMRRCVIPIDIAFLDADGAVVWMHAMQVEPDPNAPEYRLKRYDSHYPSQLAIELQGGTLRRLGLSQGDRIDLPLVDLKGRAR